MSGIDMRDAPDAAWIEAIRARFPTERAVDETLTLKLQRRASGPHRPQSLAAVSERLTAFLRKRVSGACEIRDVQSLAGGSSKEQFAFTLRETDASGAVRERRLALRMRPAASIVETHPLREFQALRAVQGVLPVPEPLWADPDGEELGQPALIYTFCEGVTKPPRDGAYTSRPGFGARYRALLAPQFVRHFAALAALDWSRADMSAFDAPPAGSNAGVLSLINWWERVWVEDSMEPYPLLTLTAQWLRANAPPIDHVSLLHQDFRGGNFLFDLADGRITAYLDWELAALGDRHADLAYFLSPLFTERDDDGRLLMGGLMTREEFLAEYERLSGLPVDQARLDYYEIYCMWRGLINSLGTAPRVMSGAKTHQDIRVGWIIGTAPVLMQTLHDAMARRL